MGMVVGLSLICCLYARDKLRGDCGARGGGAP